MPKVKNVIAALPEAEVIDVEALRGSIERGETGLVCVLGPTASGKTKYAVGLARELGGCEILSADSRQVYWGMDIGTGKDLAEYGDVPYHLIDIAEPGTQYNVHRFCEDFAAAVADIRSRGAFPILCGGTGLYLSAVTCGYDFVTRKPLSAPPDRAAAGGVSGGAAAFGGVAAFGSAVAAGGAAASATFFIGTLVTREERNARIDSRLDARLREGMINEVQGLLDRGVPASVLISYGLEYKYVTLYLQGELDYASMRERLAIAIHQFAKRQMTWFRGMERSGLRIHWTQVPQ